MSTNFETLANIDYYSISANGHDNNLHVHY